MADQELRADRSGTSEMRRLAQQSIENAHRMLSAGSLDDTAVHEARKEIRRSRATVRLLRVALGGPRFRQENTRLRDVGRALNGARDAKVLVATLDVVRRDNPKLAGDAAVLELSRRLRARQRLTRRELHRPRAPVALARRTLEQTQFSAGQWPVQEGGWSQLGPAFMRVYAAARDAARRSRTRADDHRLHEWRKQVKYLRHALQVLTPLRPPKLSKHAKLARQLVETLGDGHDLALLRQSALARPDDEAPLPDVRNLLTAIDRRRRELRHRAFALADEVFAESPRELDHRLRRYWHHWHSRNK
jgi:CHAD domain-containing protein